MTTITTIPDEAIKDSRSKINTNFTNLNTDKAESSALTSHTSNTSNPHTVTATQVGKDTAQWNASKIQGKTVDNAAIGNTKVLSYILATDKIEWVDADTPGAHASTHQNGGADEISVTGLSGELADNQPPKAHQSSHAPLGADALLLDEDDMSSDSATKGASQQSIKAYVDNHTTTASGASVYNSTGQTISNTTSTVLTFDSEQFDTSSYHNTSTNTSRLTVATAGKYVTIASIIFDINATGRRQFIFRKNGVDLFGSTQEVEPVTTGGYSVCKGNLLVDLSANDYIECAVYQSSGGNLAVIGNDTGNSQTSVFQIYKVN